MSPVEAFHRSFGGKEKAMVGEKHEADEKQGARRFTLLLKGGLT